MSDEVRNKVSQGDLPPAKLFVTTLEYAFRKL